MLIYNAASFFMNTNAGSFFTGMIWSPGNSRTNPSYGLLPLLASTMMVTLGALLIAIPLGITTSVFIAEYARSSVRKVLKPAIELLAALPSVVVGFLGIVLVSPLLSDIFGLSNGLNALNGSILLSIMALPTIITVSEDALYSIPHSVKEASYALGAKKWDTIYRVVLPAAYPGIISAVMLGMGRAIGETMTVLMATGNAAAFPHGFLDSVRTITATIAIEMGEVPYQTPHYFSLFALALVLFIITMIANIIAERIAQMMRRFR
jgi:phosphate transport system permease protein